MKEQNSILKECQDLEPVELIEEAIVNKEGLLATNGAFVVETGTFTGRSPKDRYIVKDNITENSIYWINDEKKNNSPNMPFLQNHFDEIYQRVKEYLKTKKCYTREAYVCKKSDYTLKLKVINTFAWHNLFAHHMFLRKQDIEDSDILQQEYDFTIICVPEYKSEKYTKSKNFVIINFSKKIVLIGGTKYSGEIKKSVFSILNFILPIKHNVFPMHCAANKGKKNDTALFFGLSGTGKTTLSTDFDRHLIGDDEHGWDETSIFNFEGGCYAKTLNLSSENEPQIFNAIKFGTILENVMFYKNTREVNYADSTLAENSRTSYPIYNVANYVTEKQSDIPKNIFFLTCDAYGVLPPIAKLNIQQSMYHFLSGYTAKIAGTQHGIVEPEATFQACFGLPFLPLHPIKYVNMLGDKLQKHSINVWLVNTGWIGGPYGVGNRMQICDSKMIIRAVLSDKLNNIKYSSDNIFRLSIPQECYGIDSKILNPKILWNNKESYDKQAISLINMFKENFLQYQNHVSLCIQQGSLGYK